MARGVSPTFSASNTHQACSWLGKCEQGYEKRRTSMLSSPVMSSGMSPGVGQWKFNKIDDGAAVGLRTDSRTLGPIELEGISRRHEDY